MKKGVILTAQVQSNEILFKEEVLSFCMSMLRNPFHPSNRLEGGVKLDSECSKSQNESSLAKAIQNNKKACLFEQEYHGLPLVSDSDEDLIRWDRTKDLLTTALLMTAIPTKVPTIASVSPEDILEAREKLRDFLPSFRNEILSTAWEIAKASRDESRDEILDLAKLYYETRIEPAMSEIESKIVSENTKLFRRLLERGVDKTVLFAKSLDPTDPLSKWDLVASGLKSILDVDQSIQTRAELKSPYEFLVRLPKALRV